MRSLRYQRREVNVFRADHEDANSLLERVGLDRP